MKYQKIINGITKIIYPNTSYIVVENGRVITNPSEKILIENGYTMVEEKDIIPTLDNIKYNKLSQLELYDSLEKGEVNCFYINDKPIWIDSLLRLKLTNSINNNKTLGIEISTIWDGDTPYTLYTDLALSILSQVEDYAFKCFNVTATHKLNIKNLSTIEEVNNYDFTTGYPEKLKFNY